MTEPLNIFNRVWLRVWSQKGDRVAKNHCHCIAMHSVSPELPPKPVSTIASDNDGFTPTPTSVNKLVSIKILVSFFFPLSDVCPFWKGRQLLLARADKAAFKETVQQVLITCIFQAVAGQLTLARVGHLPNSSDLPAHLQEHRAKCPQLSPAHAESC